ncbi:MAG: calcium-binding protein [Pseudomonadota bacterium]
MARFLQYELLPYTDISQTIFFGGTDIENATGTGFTTSFLSLTLVFTGTGLTYDAAGNLTGGTVEEFRLYDGAISVPNQLLIAEFELSATDLAAAFALVDAGDLSDASDLILNDWLAEHFWHTNYAGGPLKGYAGAQSLYGGSNVDIVHGYGGDDAILLQGGNDFGYGGSGNDRIWGYAGNDAIFGQSGRDTLDGGEGSDTIAGGDDGDWLYGKEGADLLRGNDGDDYLDGAQGSDTLIGGAGNDTLVAGGGTDTDKLIGGSGHDSLSGSGGNNIMLGGSGNDTLNGKAGDDRLVGNAGDDTIIGGFGLDTIVGGDSDRMTGGGDADRFILTDTNGGASRITDFADDVDTLVLRLFGFADAAALEDAATDTAAGHLVFDLGDGQTLTVLNTTFAALSDDIIF